MGAAQYADEEYAAVVEGLDETWTRRETDHLFDLCHRFDLRFPVIEHYWVGAHDTAAPLHHSRAGPRATPVDHPEEGASGFRTSESRDLGPGLWSTARAAPNEGARRARARTRAQHPLTRTPRACADHRSSSPGQWKT